MTKPASADISNLFRKFAGDSGSYHEIKQAYIAEVAQQSWPIVEAIKKERATAPVLKSSGLPPHQAARNQPIEEPVYQSLSQSPKHATRPVVDQPLASIFNRQNQSPVSAPVIAQASTPRAPMPRAPSPSPVSSPVAPSLFGNRPSPVAPQSSRPLFSSPQTPRATDNLSSVFARLEQTAQPEAVSQSPSGLRGMMRFLNKS